MKSAWLIDVDGDLVNAAHLESVQMRKENGLYVVFGRTSKGGQSDYCFFQSEDDSLDSRSQATHVMACITCEVGALDPVTGGRAIVDA